MKVMCRQIICWRLYIAKVCLSFPSHIGTRNTHIGTQKTNAHAHVHARTQALTSTTHTDAHIHAHKHSASCVACDPFCDPQRITQNKHTHTLTHTHTHTHTDTPTRSPTSVVHHPPCCNPQTVHRTSAHTDTPTLTLLRGASSSMLRPSNKHTPTQIPHKHNKTHNTRSPSCVVRHPPYCDPQTSTHPRKYHTHNETQTHAHPLAWCIILHAATLKQAHTQANTTHTMKHKHTLTLLRGASSSMVSPSGSRCLFCPTLTTPSACARGNKLSP